MLPTTLKEVKCESCPRDLRAGERTTVMAMRKLIREARNGGTVTAHLTKSGEWIIKSTMNCNRVRAEN